MTTSVETASSASRVLQLKNLVAIAIIEKDTNDDLFVWSFPAVDDDAREVLKARSGIKKSGNAETSFVYSKYKTLWHYSVLSRIENAKNSKVQSASVCILSELFNPEKFNVLAECALRAYSESLSPVPALKVYLNVVTSGKVKEEKYGTFTDADYDMRRAFIGPVKELIKLFGQDCILIWIAVLLKKRIFVYAEKLSDLLSLVRCVPLLGAWHRQNYDMLRPFCGVTENELKDLQNVGVFVAGFTTKECFAQLTMYDLLIDVSTCTVTVTEQAKGDFVLGKFHTEFAETFTSLGDEKTDQAVIKEIALKTRELITQLQTLKANNPAGDFVTAEFLSTQKLAPNMDRFLYNVAMSEGMCKKS